MSAIEILRERLILGPGEFIEVVVWQVPAPVPPSDHDFKYRVVYVHDGVRVVGYDNERGKGDHRHVAGREIGYLFTTVAQMLEDFEADVVRVRGGAL